MAESESSQMYPFHENTFTKAHVSELLNALGEGEYVIEGKSKVPSDELALFFRNPTTKEVQ